MMIGRRVRRDLDADEDDIGGGPVDPILAQTEHELRDLVIEQTQKMVQRLAPCIAGQSAPRALRLIQRVVRTQHTLITALALAGVVAKDGKTLEDYDEGNEGEDLDYRPLQRISTDHETYGAQAMNQIAQIVRQVIPQQSNPATDLEKLLREYRIAKDAGLEQVAESIRVRIGVVLEQRGAAAE